MAPLHCTSPDPPPARQKQNRSAAQGVAFADARAPRPCRPTADLRCPQTITCQKAVGVHDACLLVSVPPDADRPTRRVRAGGASGFSPVRWKLACYAMRPPVEPPALTVVLSLRSPRRGIGVPSARLARVWFVANGCCRSITLTKGVVQLAAIRYASERRLHAGRANEVSVMELI